MKKLFLFSILSLFTINAQAEHHMEKHEEAIFAGGCFWCIESDFEKLDGVMDAISGYSGGHVENPAYKQVSSGTTGHIEVVKVIYDPSKVSYEKLLDYFWRHIDPTAQNSQFCDHGEQYRSAIFYKNDEQKKILEASKAEVAKILKQEIFTDILPEAAFYNAEEYHQSYYTKNPLRYKYYRYSCGRDARVKELWEGK